MRVILGVLCSAAILATIVEQGKCAEKRNQTSAPKVTTEAHDAVKSGKATEPVILTNRTKRTRRETVKYTAEDIYGIRAQRRRRRTVSSNGVDSDTVKRSLTFNDGTHEHEHHHDVQGPGVCHSYKFLLPNEAMGHVFGAGYDIYGHELGICEAVVSGVLTPGKYREDWGACLIPHGTKEHRLTSDFKVLTMPQAKYFSWEHVSDGQVPGHGMAWGQTSDGAPVYIARCLTSFDGRKTLVPGKMDHGTMRFPFLWKERVCDQQSVEVLTCKGAPRKSIAA